MPSTTDFNFISIKNEFLNKLRVNLNAYDSLSRITESTKVFDGDGSTTNFSLGSTMSYVKSVTVSGTPLVFKTEWDIVWRGTTKGSVELVIPPVSGTDNVVIVWGSKGSIGNFIIPDFPRTNIGESSYPKIGFKMSVNTKIAGCGGGGDIPYLNEILIQIKIISNDTYEIDYLIGQINDFILKNCKNFYYFNYIDPQSINEYDNFRDNTDKPFQKITEFKIPFKYNIVTLA